MSNDFTPHPTDIKVKKVGSRSAVIHQVVKLRGSDTVVADADVTFVLYDANTGAAVSMDSACGHCLRACPDGLCRNGSAV